MDYKDIAEEINASLGTDFVAALEGKINDEYAYFAYDTIDDPFMGDDCEYAVIYKVAKVNRRHLWRVTKYYRIWSSDGYYHDSEQDWCDFWLNSRQRKKLTVKNVVPLIWNDGYYTSVTYGNYCPRTPWGDNPAFMV